MAIPDLLLRFKRLVEIEHDPRIITVPPVDIYTELAREWFGRSNITFEDRQFLMAELKKRLDRDEMFNAMHQKFGKT
jgi:hypothetical protein